jgi:hypothetical protein
MDGSSIAAARTAEAPPRLYCLGGGEAPPGLGADLRRLVSLPTQALEKLWQVLAPSLAETIAKETEELLDVFCSAYGADPDELGRVIKACRFVIREAAQRDVPAAAVAQDLDRLCPGDPLVRELLMAGYGAARERIRHEIVKAAVSDHGKLLVGIKWRLDAIQASEGGLQLKMPVALVTLHYLEGSEAGRVTLQVLPDMMGELKNVCEKVLG